MIQHKTFAFIFILNLLFSYSQAQIDEADKIRNNEFSIVVDDIFAKTPIIYYPYFYLDNQVFLPYYDFRYYDITTTKIGLGYKHHFNNSGIRTKLSFGTKSDRTEYSDNDNTEEYNYLSTNFYLGYEWLLKFRKAHIFYGAEAFVNYENLKSIASYYNEFNNEQTSESTSVNTGYGVSPLLGVKYFIAGPLSVSTEFKFNVEFVNGKTTFKHSELPTESETKHSGMETSFGPLGQLSVNIHF